MDKKEPQEVEAKPRGEPRMVEERTIRYQGFETVEDAKDFLAEIHKELEQTQRRFDEIFRGTRSFFSGVDQLLTVWTQPSVDREIEYHKEQIKQLEEQKERKRR